MFKKHIVKALKWALSKFEDKPVEVWPFPVKVEKKKPQVKKATTRTVAKKATKVVKKAK
jgi:hypothetical protein